MDVLPGALAVPKPLRMDSPDFLRPLLCALGDAVREEVIAARAKHGEALAGVAGQSAADTIYAIDRIGEAMIGRWFAEHWPGDQPVQVVMEGMEDALCFPAGMPVKKTKWKCLLDPIDGTRGIMYDKRSAWMLAGIAPQKGEATMLSDIVVAAMTELPTSKQWRADQVSAVRGGGIVAESVNVLDGSRRRFELRPSQATDFRHGFSWMAKFFPEGRTLTAQIEEELWDELVGLGREASPTIFDDQYICTGGAFYELLAGHDRFVADLRPLVYACLDLEFSLTCHPYDVCTALLLQEAGVIYEHPSGEFPDAPLDTTSDIAWVAFANETLAASARPVLQKILLKMLV